MVSSPEQQVHSRDSDNFGEANSINKFNKSDINEDFFFTDDETTPPGTPPPPYKIKTKSTSDAKHATTPKRSYFHSANAQSSDSVPNNPISHNLSEHEDFMANDSIFNTQRTFR